MTQGELLVPDAAAWRAWLEENHASSDGVWLVIGKKNGTTTALTYEEAVLEALGCGWSDGRTQLRYAQGVMQRLTPRRPGSPGSASNIRRVSQLAGEGRMAEAWRAAGCEA